METSTVAGDHPCAELYTVLLGAKGWGLVELVMQADTECIADLEWVSDGPLQISVSQEANVITIANAIVSILENEFEPAAEEIERMYLYLTQVKDIHYWCLTRRSCDGAEWSSARFYSMGRGSPVNIAVKNAIDATAAYQGASQSDAFHARILASSMVAAMDYELNGYYLTLLSDWLVAWDDQRASNPAYQHLLHQLFELVYQGHRQRDFGRAFGENRELLHAFEIFILDPRRLGTESQWIMERIAEELGHYTKYKHTTNYGAALPVIRSALKTYEDDPRGKTISLLMISEINYYDAENCARYGLCDWYEGGQFNAKFRDRLFSDRLECPRTACEGNSITILAQHMEPEKLELACQRLYDYGRAFHEICGTDCEPVHGDSNSHLEVYVFNDGRSCELLESAAFGENPDSCSGIYWEGNPLSSRDPARLVVTEYTADENPRDPDLAIWNFAHEYAHYLDGRYNRRGAYRDAPSIHWWVEGFAEYFADETSPYIDTPSLQSPYTLADTLLYSGSIPTKYSHRHLAVRYLMENQREFVDVLLGFMRSNKYQEYRKHMASEAPKFEAEWQSWLSSGQ